MMKRRCLIGVVAGVLILGPHDSEAQRGETTFRIGFLNLNTAESARDNVAAFRQGLEERGWIEALESDERRRPYRLTPTGRGVLHARVETLRAVTRVARARLANA